MRSRSAWLGAFALLLATAPARADDACASALQTAKTAESGGTLLAARDAYMKCAADTCTPKVRAECERRLAGVEQATPSASFVVRDEAGRDVEAVVTLDDGGPNARVAPIGRAIPLDPGMHSVTWTTPDGARGERRFAMAEGEQRRIVVLVAPSAQPKEQGAASASPSKPWPWVLVAGGGALILGGGIFEVLALVEDGKREQRLVDAGRTDLTPAERDAMWSSAESHYQAAHNDERIAITFGVIGVASLAAGVTWLLLDARHPSPARATIRPTLGGVAGSF